MNDIVKKFFEFYVKGDLQAAVEQIIPSPYFSYDNFQSADDLLRQLINFIDASVFGITSEAKFQSLILRDFIAKQAKNKNLQIYHEVKDILKLEDQMLLLVEKENFPLQNLQIEKILTHVPEKFQVFVKFHLKMTCAWENFKRSKPLFLTNFSRENSELHPWYPVKYDLQIPSIEGDLLDRIPVIFFEPIKEDLSNFLQQLKGRPAIFAFTTLACFFQMLQFAGFEDSLGEPEHLIYILEIYPNQQFATQDVKFIKSKEFYPIFFAPTKSLEAYVPILLQALKENFLRPNHELAVDTMEGNWAYEVAKRLLLSIQQDRLGMSRLPALTIRSGQQKWYDLHKGPVPIDKPLGPDINEPMKVLLSNLASQRVVRTPVAKEKILLAHIVPQIVFGGHAPTRILENLVLHHDPQKFDMIVISTELLRELPLEYPYNFYTSPSSEDRGGPTISKFKKIHVKTILNRKSLYYLSNALELNRLLKDYQVDVAVFHGPDLINTMTAQIIDVPLRVLFEHGSQAVYPGFDLAILSSESAVELYHNHYEKIQTQAIALPFAVDVRKGWLSEPYQRESLGLPEEGFILTTISTKLDRRLTDELCRTIASILKRVEKAYYAPIGTINHPERIKKIFAEYGVADRFYPLGSATSPASQYARCMDLYLNEFPFGGCLAILDAMAAGLPVVTMYDANGPQQARYGGNFIGIDRAVTSGNPKEYAELACQLLTNLSMYKEWSHHSVKQYETFADVKNYVRSFENILIQAYTLKIPRKR